MISKKEISMFFVFSILMFGFMDASFAAGTGFGALATNVGSNSIEIGKGVQLVGFLVGIILVISGIVAIVNAKKSNQPIGGAVMMLVAGFLLVSVAAFINSGSDTIFGGGANAGGNALGLL